MIGSLPSETLRAVPPRSECITIGHAFPSCPFFFGGKRQPSAVALLGRDRWLAKDCLDEVEPIYPRLQRSLVRSFFDPSQVRRCTQWHVYAVVKFLRSLNT